METPTSPPTERPTLVVKCAACGRVLREHIPLGGMVIFPEDYITIKAAPADTLLLDEPIFFANTVIGLMYICSNVI